MRPSDDLTAVAALHDPLRRQLYRYVASRPSPVGRDEAAEALDVPRSVAAFHLDKLADVGLLAVEFRRPAGRSGPGAGRPAKLYRPSGSEFSLSVPDRRYALAASLLAEAVAEADAQGTTAGDAARSVARRYGHELASVRRAKGGRVSAADLAALLSDQGYQPNVTGGVIVLTNCPFHAVANQERDLMCGMNLELLDGVLQALGATAWQARLDPVPGRCCVTIRRRR